MCLTEQPWLGDNNKYYQKFIFLLRAFSPESSATLSQAYWNISSQLHNTSRTESHNPQSSICFIPSSLITGVYGHASGQFLLMSLGPMHVPGIHSMIIESSVFYSYSFVLLCNYAENITYCSVILTRNGSFLSLLYEEIFSA